MSFVSKKEIKPRSLTFRKKVSVIPLLVSGQGVFLFEHTDVKTPCALYFSGDSDFRLSVYFSQKGVRVIQHSPEGDKDLVDPQNTKGLVTTPGAYYWFSLDAQNQNLQAGIGEARTETVIYRYQFSPSKETKQGLDSLIKINADSVTRPLRLLRDPITRNVPLSVRGTDQLTMTDIAKGSYMPSANLDAINQKLYGCISGANFILDDKDFPEFSQAIEYSIATPGCWCHEKLIEKSSDFGGPLETYLRITLNENNGESPGVPYVMEIWPVGHYSPIHDHAGANAVIRVLNGGIHVTLFNFLGGDSFGEANFSKGDITWISPTLNQVHQLKNLDSNKDTCITIQCYMYDQEDTLHYEYFDYLDRDGNFQKFEPDSDMDFLKFKETMRTEWLNR